MNPVPEGEPNVVTTFYLVRHGETDLAARALAGRMPGITLNAVGRKQAEKAAHELAQAGLQQIFSSPLERCQETAAALGKITGLPVQICPAIQEVDFGQWTSRTFAELESDPAWKQWNTFRSAGQVPGGESMAMVQARVVGEITKLRLQFPDQALALFSHADPIRAALAYFLGMPLDNLLRLHIAPGSTSVLRIDGWSATLLASNRVPE